MKVTDDCTNTTSTRVICISGAEKMPVTGYAFKGKEYQPESIRLRWFNDVAPSQVTVFGRVFKKDGTLGAQVAECEYALTGKTYYYRTAAPDWLRELLAK